ncbi:MAG: hypothetical protein ACOH5I_18070 [Oligoflexus sp.]
MKAILSTLTLLLSTSTLWAQDSLQFTTATASLGCQSLIKEEHVEESKVSLVFFENTMQVDKDDQIDYVHCKIFWKPDIPKGFRLTAGGNLSLRGYLVGAEFVELRLRLAHELLGQEMTNVGVYNQLDEGEFHLTQELKLMELTDCNSHGRLNSSFSVFLRRLEDLSDDAQMKETQLNLQELTIDNVKLEACEV